MRMIGRKTPSLEQGNYLSFDKDYFNRNYADYALQTPQKKCRFYIDSILTVLPHGRLLDIGCSFGLFLREATSHFTCSGMDTSFDVVSEAATHVPDANFIVGKLPTIPFQEMDVITALDVLEHLPDPEHSLIAIRNALRAGGIALIVIPVYDGPLGWLTHLLDRDPTHLHKIDRYQWITMASRHFELIQWYGFLRKVLCRRYYLHIPMVRMRSIAPAIGMLLRKHCP